MIKKIIHIADIHIRTFKMHDVYGEVFKAFFKECRELVKDYERDEVRIVIVGDLVHQKITISNESITLLSWFLKKLEQIAPVVIVAGNHDLLENNKNRLDSITPVVNLLEGLEINYLKGESACHLDNNIVWCNYSIFDDNNRPDIEAARAEHGDKRYIGLYHAPVQGAQTDGGFQLEHSTTFEHFEGCDMVLLGDIHMRQHWNYQGCPIAYPSSLIQQNFGETVSKHGFLWWDVADKTFEEFDIETRYGFYQFKIKSVEDVENNEEIITNA
jgi:DNA repair exonuclease SbcCD nuclease subunit